MRIALEFSGFYRFQAAKALELSEVMKGVTVWDFKSENSPKGSVDRDYEDARQRNNLHAQSQRNAVSVLIVMPTYNEGENLSPTLAHVFSKNPQVSIVVVDDDSPDGTGRVADFLAQGDDRVHVIHRHAKEGLGPAYIEGFHWGLEQGYDVICEMDMDGSHRAEDLTRMLAVLNRNPSIDLVIGSRRIEGGQTINWSPTRNAISRLGSWYARHMLALPVHDMTAGFRAYKAEILRAIDLDGINANGYVFQIDMTRRVAAAGGRIREVPIAFVERTRGKSKMTQSIVVEAMLKVTLWGIRRLCSK